MYKIFKDEFHLAHLKLDFKEPSYFVRPQEFLLNQPQLVEEWSWCSSRCFLFYKFAFFGYCASWLVWTTIKECVLLGRGSHALMEFSYWTLILLTTHTLVTSFGGLYHHVIRPKQTGWQGTRAKSCGEVDFPMSVSTEPITLNEDTSTEVQVRVITDVKVIMPWYLRLSWLFHTLALDSSLVLVLCYWTLLFHGHFSNTQVHNTTILPLLILLDLWISKQPTHLIHVAFSILYFTLYTAAASAYCVNHSMRHYDVIKKRIHDYDAMCVYERLNDIPTMFVLTGCAVVALLCYPVMRALGFLVYRWRVHVWERHDQPG